ncbi:hypothetical protein [Methylobacterium sp. 10]|uniref:hypothetical protein n=1 Tax=Methylobacterium sp. 10 TaxID=1101191 RepID=UPI0004B13503|nr:hypothetical protein [Methylobacterium sp. 10]
MLGLLDGYRNQLAIEARKRGVNTRFTYDDLASGETETRRDIDGDAYLSRRLALGYA